MIAAAGYDSATVNFKSVQATLITRRAQLDIVRQALEDATITAPISGTVISRPVSLGTLLVLAGTGYVDNVATDPAARGRGYAGAVVTRIGEESRRAGADGPFLLCDPGSAAIVRFYERLGFAPVGFLASTKGPIPDV